MVKQEQDPSHENQSLGDVTYDYDQYRPKRGCDYESFRMHSLKRISNIEAEMEKIGDHRDKRYQALRKKRNG